MYQGIGSNHHPQTQGQVERMNGKVVRHFVIAAAQDPNQLGFELGFSDALGSPSRRLGGVSACEVLFGAPPRPSVLLRFNLKKSYVYF